MPYWVKSGQNQFGPLSAAKVKEMALSGQLKTTDQVSTDKERWVLATKVKGLVFSQNDQPQVQAELDDEYRLAPMPDLPEAQMNAGFKPAPTFSQPAVSQPASLPTPQTCPSCCQALQSLLRNGSNTGRSICVRCQVTPGICPGCHEPLRTVAARQCLSCGASWHVAGHADSNIATAFGNARARIGKEESSPTPLDKVLDESSLLAMIVNFVIYSTGPAVFAVSFLLMVIYLVGDNESTEYARPTNKDQSFAAISPASVRTEFREVLVSSDFASSPLGVEFPEVTALEGKYHFQSANVVADVGGDDITLHKQINKQTPWGTKISNVGRDAEEDVIPTLMIDLKPIADELKEEGSQVDLLVSVKIEYPVRESYLKFVDKVQHEKRSVRVLHVSDEAIAKNHREYYDAWKWNRLIVAACSASVALCAAFVFVGYYLFLDPVARRLRQVTGKRFPLPFRSDKAVQAAERNSQKAD